MPTVPRRPPGRRPAAAGVGELVEDVALVGHRLHSSTGTDAVADVALPWGAHTTHPATAHRRRVATTGTAIAALAALEPGRLLGGGDDDAALRTDHEPSGAATAAGATATGRCRAAPSASRARRRGRAHRPPAGVASATHPDAGHRPGASPSPPTPRCRPPTCAPPSTSCTTTVTAHGGHVASADIDYGDAERARPPPSRRDPAAAPGRRSSWPSRPASSVAVRDSARRRRRRAVVSTSSPRTSPTSSTDLETRITNQRASIARIRELYANGRRRRRRSCASRPS